MKILKNKQFKDVYIVQNKTYKDDRGYFKELLRENFIKKKFPFQVMSFSKKNVLRGLHMQKKNSQGKFVSVVKGKIFDVIIDLRKNSKTFGKKYSIILSEKNSKSLYIPEGFAHGFCTLDKENYVVYNCSKYRDKNNEIGLMYNDNDLKINWPIDNPIMSKKDKENYSLKELEFIL